MKDGRNRRRIGIILAGLLVLAGAGTACALIMSSSLPNVALKVQNQEDYKAAFSTNDSSVSMCASSSESPQNSKLVSAPSQTSSQAASTANSSGIFSAYTASAQQKLNSMTLEEKIGQLFIFTCPNTGAEAIIKKYQPCGYCFLASHFRDKTKAQVVQMTSSFQAASKIKMILCADEEGGTVTRLSWFPALALSKFQSPQTIFSRSGLAGIYDDTVKKSQILLSLGINLNLAPVADVSTNQGDFMYDRSFGHDAQQTAQFVTTFVNAANSRKMSSTLKHFPGYGNNADTHTGIAYDNRSYERFTKSDFLPFAAGINAGAQCVMVSHNIVKCMDADFPATLSPKVHQILRDELHFTGVIMTDDLTMGAIRSYTNGKNPCAQAFLAGNDILLTANIDEDYRTLYNAVQSGTITEERINQSVLRILAWKYAMGIIE